MDASNFNAAVDELRKQLLLGEGAAHQVASRFQTLRSEAEALKIATLKRRLENRRKSLALQAGATSTKDRQKLGIGLGVAAAVGMIFGGVIGRDKSSVLSGGVSAFKGTLQGFGESRWAVSLDRDLLVVPDNRISSGRTWVTLESLLQALEELAEKADVGGPLGGVADIISKLKLQQSKLEYLNPPMRVVWRPTPD